MADEHERPQQRLHAPALLDELDRQPVEQLGVRRRRAHRAEVLARLDEAAPVQRLPEAVDHHARGQRVVAADQPARQAEAIRRQVVGHGRQRRRRVGVHALARRGERAAFAQRRRRPFVARLVLHHQRGRQLEVLDRLLQPRHVLAIGLERRRLLAELRGEVLGLRVRARWRAESRSRHACARSRRRPPAARPPSSWTGGTGPGPARACRPRARSSTVKTVPPGKPTGAFGHQHELERHAPAVADGIDDPRLAEPRVRDRRVGGQVEQIAARDVAVALDGLEVDASPLRGIAGRRGKDLHARDPEVSVRVASRTLLRQRRDRAAPRDAGR